MQKLLVIITIILCISCVKEARIELPYTGDKIVVNTLIQPDSLIYIRVTSSKGVTENGNLQFEELQAAEVSVWEDGVKLAPLEWKVINGLGYFVTANIAREGSEYGVRVASADLTTVFAGDSTPARPLISGGYAQRSLNRVRFTLQENVDTKDYYRMRIFNADLVDGVLVANRKDTVKFRLDPGLNINLPELITNEFKREYIISDDKINGTTIQFVLQTEKEIKSQHIMVELSALTPAAWRYMQSTSSLITSDGSVSLDPENVYSNVDNGYGIVAGINAARLGFTVE